ncbi:LacI family transcriptional regulator [Listeria monocytogenes]|uniref:LacI family DNA-binding transcriptional regulator n=1 Tax=Listeria monocytogenes TaxID=1639 RepID=UPI0008746871|nr:LacI family DNA-binding transcriptional regulator [Listeria monocytogenes]EAE3615499.1 LacI family DNA-binding transcriptional regulator [Listeria monocytogenes]EAE3653229.1 LacI family DNA-binding transcriptional regulator [Listeria monocytogenes]EAE5989540.1 LacI family DNA-binding transcriptional regulator [Listeria monocytogenes]EAE6015346.1 LacI family DNA-binding transcriptional regulator [Listeria monocytogenes]EAF0392356.1 LacI family DNA-binding transcriptional regulator [Listeria 
MKKITIQEIAKLSGVSVSTVSRVLNNSPSVSAAKRQKIQAIIDEHNYTPSVFARGMVNKQTKNIGVILPDISNPYFISLITQIQKFALDYMFSTILFNTMLAEPNNKNNQHPLTEEDYLKIILEKQVDGLLILGGEIDKEIVSKEYITALNQLNKAIPVVVIGSKIPELNCLFIERNFKKGVTTLVSHLTALGHKNIGFIGGEAGVKITTYRLESFKEAMASYQHPINDDWVVLSDYYTADGYAAMTQLLENSATLPSALVAINDNVAIGAIRAINDANLSCPEDIAIVSCDQFMNGDYQTPRLTSMDQHNEYLGKMAILQLISAINGQVEPMIINHNPELIIRESCGSKL